MISITLTRHPLRARVFSRSYSVGLVIWTSQVFWFVWCGEDGRQCEERWLRNPRVLLNVSKCVMAFQLGRLGALVVGK